jgi:hypothetical protein
MYEGTKVEDSKIDVDTDAQMTMTPCEHDMHGLTRDCRDRKSGNVLGDEKEQLLWLDRLHDV